MDTQAVIRQALEADRLRFITLGSVDDGKSTLIGRLLHDADGIFEDQLKSMRRGVKGGQSEVDFAYLTDGLKAEREQGITIDVAYRYFSTPRRRFAIADAPGHEQYTRNMVTGASTADLAVILIDARQGALTQSKRHGFIASLLGIQHLVVVANKMDLVGYAREAFEKIRREFGEFAARLGVRDLAYIPVSALKGDNVVHKSRNMPWYEGPPLLTHLETVYIAGDTNLIDLRFPVQSVIRTDAGFRGYAGQAASGVMRVGDAVLALPSGRKSRIARIVTCGGDAEYAFAPQSVTVCLEDDIDVSRGDMIVHPANLPRVAGEVEAMIVWMDERPLEPGRQYIVKHTTNMVRAEFAAVNYRIDPDELHRQPASLLRMNDVGRALLRLHRPVMCDEYARNRRTGAFIVIDPETNNTAAAGVVIERARPAQAQAPEEKGAAAEGAPKAVPSPAPRRGAVTLWITGLSGSGKSTIASALERRLTESGHCAYVLDGDHLRRGLNSDLGFSPEDRRENIRRAAEVARLFNEAGVTAIVSFISPYRADRKAAMRAIGEGRFVEIFADAPLSVCESRDAKGLYRKARAGEVPDFTGVSAPYEEPESPDVRLRTDCSTPAECAEQVMAFLQSKKLLSR